MQIIPVIDVMGGIVVHASGGIRDQYQPLQSVLTSSCEPIEVISELLARYKSKIIYIADIDAIRNHHLILIFIPIYTIGFLILSFGWMRVFEQVRTGKCCHNLLAFDV